MTPDLRLSLPLCFAAASPEAGGASPHAEPVSLAGARCGERLRIVGLRPGSSACLRLRELGFCESAEICKVVDGGALICVLQGVRLAIGRDLGADVLVERLRP